MQMIKMKFFMVWS